MDKKDLSKIYRELELRAFDFTLHDLEKTFKELEIQFNSPPSSHDVAWRTLNMFIKGSDDLYMIGFAYRKMAIIAEREGKEVSEFMDLAHEFELKNLALKGVTEVEIENKHTWKKQIARTKICDVGKKLIGKKFSIEEAINNKPIPTRCEKGSQCICRYKPSDEDDLRRYREALRST